MIRHHKIIQKAWLYSRVFSVVGMIYDAVVKSVLKILR